MTIEQAKEILKGITRADDSLYDLSNYTSYSPRSATITLDGEFGSEELDAMATYMRYCESLDK